MSKKSRRQIADSNNSLFREIRPKTPNQNDYFRCIAENDVTICYGPSGTGKTICAIGLAIEYFYSHRIDKILISRSVVACDNDLGAMPGPLESKVGIYMRPYLDYLMDFIPNKDVLFNLIDKRAIILEPVEILRGRTYDNTFMIIDESQNCTPRQLKMFMTRIGKNSKMVVIGDNRQSDIQKNGLKYLLERNLNTDGIGVVKLGEEDILRNGIIGKIISIFESGGVY